MKSVRIAIIVLALAAAAGITICYNAANNPFPDSADSITRWKCVKCQAVFDLTSRQVMLAQEDAKGIPIHCPQCFEVGSYQMMTCLTCGTFFIGANVEGESGQCPKCHPEAEPFREDADMTPEEIQARQEQPKQI